VDATYYFQINETNTRGHPLKLYKNACMHNFRKYFFTHRVVDTWNALPAEVVNSVSVNSFKARLDKYLNNRGFI